MPSLADLARLVRAPAALSVPGDVLAGAAAAGGLNRRSPALAAASVLLYWAGMAGNDWADRELDAVERPDRPIPSGRVRPGEALGIAVGLTVAGVAVAGLAGGRRALAAAVPLAGTIWAYDLVAKNTAAGPAVMATCRGLDVLLGAGARPARALPAAAVVAAHTWTVTALSRREVHGAHPALPMSTLAGTATVAAAAVVGSGRPAGWQRQALTAVLAGWYAAGYGTAQARAAANPDAQRVRAAVGAGITGLPALQGALLARAGAGVPGLAVALAAPLGRRLARKVSPT